MVLNKSLDSHKIIAAVLHDVFILHDHEFNSASRRNTLKKVSNRLASEGLSFLTKTLPRLGKAFDKAIAGSTPLNSTNLRFEPQEGSQLPKLFGELFNKVLTRDGKLLSDPCGECVRSIRQICYLFYKYELPYSAQDEQRVIDKFKGTEDELLNTSERLDNLRRIIDNTKYSSHPRGRESYGNDVEYIAREAKILLAKLFARFDPLDIYPRHGPGAVATKQQLWEKYLWTNVSGRITEKYPLDAYFYASLGAFCDNLSAVQTVDDQSLPAKVVLVPKDSRGPRLISCESVDNQWIQQGLGRAIVQLVENSVLTKYNVFYTDQVPNRVAALLGSRTGRYATLDLNEASDRVSLSLVRLLFPAHICEYLECCRSLATVLPDGSVLPLRKFAPMGSCLCFPIMSLTIWALLTAASPDADTRESIHVYGDDVIVPTAFAEDAMNTLTSFGLKINQDKSCTDGLFRESCGCDAFKGIDVTPVRLRTVWSEFRSPDVYASWIAYANSFYCKRYFNCYELIVEALHRNYGAIPAKDMNLSCPSLVEVPECQRPKRRRTNKSLQKLQWWVWDVKSVVLDKELDGWSMLLRQFADWGRPAQLSEYEKIVIDNSRPNSVPVHTIAELLQPGPSTSVSQYTRRRASMLVRRWR